MIVAVIFVSAITMLISGFLLWQQLTTPSRRQSHRALTSRSATIPKSSAEEVAALHRQFTNALLGDEVAVRRLVQYEREKDARLSDKDAYLSALERLRKDNERFG